jgi:predicted GIY-YIG superfamily endonuclease
MTTHKCQGVTIHGHYNIYESERMSADVLYTAMSRGTKREYVHLVSKKSGRYYESSRADSVLVAHEPIKMKTGRIYRIDLSDGSVYIGKTIQTLEERFEEHKKNPTNEGMTLALDERATIRLVEEFQYKEERRLRDAEQIYIVQHNAATS